jgi:glycosyltransferase involved in cell wall biosynthesis
MRLDQLSHLQLHTHDAIKAYMRIALTESWPNLFHSAEREFMRRFEQAAARAGHTVVVVTTSDDIHEANPDFVLCMHEYTPKLTPYPTFGVLWGPPEFYRGDAYRVRSIRSYDAYLVGSEEVRRYLDDLEFQSKIKKQKSSFHFLPVAPFRPLSCGRGSMRRTLAYAGIHWDGDRHGEIISELANAGVITVYGPKARWSKLRTAYGGSIDFDGSALFDVLSSHGIALCLHKQEHRDADTPSMRLFEAAAADCVIIVDEIPYAKRMLGDCALYVSLSQPLVQVVKNIQDHVRWVAANPEKATAMAHRSHDILNQDNSLEKLIGQTCSFAEEFKAITFKKRAAVEDFAASTASDVENSSCSIPSEPDRLPAIIDVILRCGGRELNYVKRAIDSIEAQSIGIFRVILVDYMGRSDLKQFAEEANYKKVSIKYVEAPNNGLRSTALWLGFVQVTAPFFAVMDDDDYVMPEHYCGLLYSAVMDSEACFYYCGVVRVEEDGVQIPAPNFTGPGKKIIPETRELKFLDEFSLGRLIAMDNYIQSNAWIARSSLLKGSVLEDPLLQFAEDMYLYLLLASKTKFVCSYHATAYWSWRSSARNNSMFEVGSDAWNHCATRICLRLQGITFPYSVSYSELRLNQQLLHNAADRLGINYPVAGTAKKKKVSPIKKWLRSFAIYNLYREARRRRKHVNHSR